MLILGLDFESNGLDVEKSHITEIGASLFDTTRFEKGKGSSIDELSCFLYDESYPPQPQNIVDLTGITDEDLKQEGIPPKTGLLMLRDLMGKADYFMAHNKKFDANILHHFGLKYGVSFDFPNTPWICSLTELEWPKNITCKKLSHIALELAPEFLFIGGEKIELHRALNDTELMVNLVDKIFNWEEVIAYATQPWITLQAIVPAPWTDGGVGKDWAKKNGYGWETPPGSDFKYEKCWVKRVKESKVTGEQNDKPYEIKRI